MQKEAESDYLYLNGKEIDQGSIVYDMQDYSDGIFELQKANYADGTELDEKELEELESTQELIDWVRIDFVSEDAVSEDNQLEGFNLRRHQTLRFNVHRQGWQESERRARQGR